MTIKTIKILAINIVFLGIIQFAISGEIILPKKKPQLSDELIQKKIIKGILVPPKKPFIQKIKTVEEEIELKIERKITKINVKLYQNQNL